MADLNTTTGKTYQIIATQSFTLKGTKNGVDFNIMSGEAGTHYFTAISDITTIVTSGNYNIQLVFNSALISNGSGGGGNTYKPNTIIVNTTPLDGSKIVAPNGKILLIDNIPATCNLSGIVLETIAGVSSTCELVLNVATAPTTVIFPTAWQWLDSQSAPELEANTTYNIVIRFDGVSVITNLAYNYSNQ